MTYVITSACMGSKDASCVEVCPVDCIYEIDRMWLIHPGECIDCGACESECPVEAIYADVDVPETEQPYIAVDAAIAEGVAAAEAALDQLLVDSGGDGGQQAA